MEEIKDTKNMKTDPLLELDENGERDWGDFEEYIIRSMLNESILVCSLIHRTDKYGNDNEKQIVSGGAHDAASYAREWGGDELTARGIYIGVALADPAFDEVGEEFLRTVLPDYTKADYGEDMIRGVLNRIKTSRKEVMIKGIRDLLEGTPNDSIEVQAVLLAQRVRNLYASIRPSNAEKASAVDTWMNSKLSFLMEDGITSIDELFEKAYQRIQPLMGKLLDEGSIRIAKPEPKSKENLKYLMFAYEYFTEHYEKIPKIDYKDLFPKYQDDRNRMTAYYVASRPERGLVTFYEQMKAQEMKHGK